MTWEDDEADVAGEEVLDDVELELSQNEQPHGNSSK